MSNPPKTSPWKNCFMPGLSAEIQEFFIPQSSSFDSSLARHKAEALFNRDAPQHVSTFQKKLQLIRYTMYIGRVHAALSFVLNILYPPRCLGCKSEVELEESFCSLCQRFLHLVQPPFCLCCGIPFETDTGPNHLCRRCQARPPSFRQARAWAVYQTSGSTPQPVSEAIQQFKYQRRLSIGKQLAAIGANVCSFADQPYDLIIPVPLHRERLRWRGFNQALILAQAIGQKLQVRVNPFLLDRTRPTNPQTQLSEDERRKNVRGAFTVVTPEQLADKAVLLIDDVYTSGATTEECARELLRHGAAAVDVFTLARAVLR
jgi:ComF family protein